MGSIVVEEQLAHLRAFDRPGRSVLKLGSDQIAAVRALNDKIRSSEVAFEEVDCLCGSSRFAEIARTDRYGLLQSTVICVRCGLIQSNPRMTDTAYRRFYESDEYRRVYEGDGFVERCEANYSDGRGEELYARVTARRPAAQIRSVLEFGAAGGWNLGPFVRAGIEVTGYDYSGELVALGKRKGLNLIQGGLDDVEGTYDVIILNHVMEHFTDAPGSLRVLREHLASDALMFVEVPDIENFYVGQIQNAHTYYFTRRTFEFCASMAGLRMLHQQREPNGHMSAVFVASDAPPLDVGVLSGHYDEMAALIRRYTRTYRLRTPIRAVGRALDSLGLKEPVRRILLPA
jgi:hypothetical protein